MKTQSLLIFIFSTLLNTNCSSQQKLGITKNTPTYIAQQSKIEKIEITEQTRGTNRIITFTPTSKIVTVNGNESTSSLSSIEWQNIETQTSIIDLSTLSLLQSPSNSRFSDGALSSKLSITANGKIYLSSEFDAGNPPKEVENLYRVLMNKKRGQKKAL